MKKAIYVNPKSGKFYAIVDNEQTGKCELFTVYDNANLYPNAPFKVDKKGRGYKVLDVRFKKTKNGYDVLETFLQTDQAPTDSAE